MGPKLRAGALATLLLGSTGAALGAGAAGSRGPAAEIETAADAHGVRACTTPSLAPAFEIDPAVLHVTEWRWLLQRTPRRLLDAYLSRPDPWKRELLPILEAHDVPATFLYLALVESGWDREARSPADAVGLWQFTDATGRQYGLRIDEGLDERTDERLSTDAAGRYLRDLFDEFGTWELAAAAYNAGPERLRRALAWSGADDYWDLLEGDYLPRETRRYVPKFLAVVQLAGERAGQRTGRRAAQSGSGGPTVPIALDPR